MRPRTACNDEAVQLAIERCPSRFHAAIARAICRSPSLLSKSHGRSTVLGHTGNRNPCAAHLFFSLSVARTVEPSGFMERAMGIEPTSEAWEASILPLYDARSALYFADYTQLSDCSYIPASFHIFQFSARRRHLHFRLSQRKRAYMLTGRVLVRPGRVVRNMAATAGGRVYIACSGVDKVGVVERAR